MGKCLAAPQGKDNHKEVPDPEIIPDWCPIKQGEIAVHEQKGSQPEKCTSCYYYHTEKGRFIN